ncbi:5'-amp-activated protein kinase subunit gamma, partial [Globisporangium splendens]
MPRIRVPIQDAYMGDGDDTPGGRTAAAERRGSASPGLSFSLNGDYQRTGSTHSLHSSSSALDLSQASVFDVVKEARKWKDIKSVPIWDADQAQFVGMFTATDFVNILRHFYIRGSPMNELAEHSIASWRDPIQNSVLSVITHSGILEFLVSTFREQRRLFDQPIYDLGIGVYSDLITVPEDMQLIRVLHTLVERRVSALPIVDSSDMPVGDILRIQAAELTGFSLFFFHCEPEMSHSLPSIEIYKQIRPPGLTINEGARIFIMGCCSSKGTLKAVNESQARTQTTGGSNGDVRVGGGGGSNVREPTMSEKRARAAEAAETRKTDWRQGGSTDPEKAKSLQQRREKDELLAQIYNRYTALGKEPPIGLPSCDIPQLRRHLETLRKQ